MDDYYDYAEARQEIDRQAKEKNTDKVNKRYQLCTWEGGIASKSKTRTAPASRTTRLVMVIESTKEVEEAVLSLQGVLVDMDLPPLNSRPRPQQLRHIRQSISLSGLGQVSFGDA
ncbi:hypothetical protein BJ138DRAFT_1105844, partial [Hygrophoropsis aurantiaca]